MTLLRFAILSLLGSNVVGLTLRHGPNECGMQNAFHSMPNDPAFLQNPGAGIGPFKPFQVVLKSGFMKIDCVKDYMYYHGDKFGPGSHNYKLGSVAQVSIVHYEDMVKKEDREQMTATVCFNFCKSVPDMQNFGLINSKKCYCSPYYEAMAGDSSSCHAQCEGDPTNFCGGSSKSTIYSMHACSGKVTSASKAAAVKAKLLKKIAKKEILRYENAKSNFAKAAAVAAAKKKVAAKEIAAAMKAKEDAKKKAIAEAALAKANAAAEAKAFAEAVAKKVAAQKQVAVMAAKKAAAEAAKAKQACSGWQTVKGHKFKAYHEKSGGVCWTLVLAYHRAKSSGVMARFNRNGVPKSPNDSNGAYFKLADKGVAQSQIVATRWFCNTTGHKRVVNFKTSEPSVIENVWKNTHRRVPGSTSWKGGWSALKGHTANLPGNGAWGLYNGVFDSIPLGRNRGAPENWSMWGQYDLKACDQRVQHAHENHGDEHLWQIWVQLK